MEFSHSDFNAFAETRLGNTAFLLPNNTASSPLGSYPVQHIDYPGAHDVMMGRGGGTNSHVGNIRFRQLVQEYKPQYIAASKSEKPKLAMTLVQTWRALDPPGRFLTKSNPEMGDDSYWHDVGDKEARKKASQCLRERTRDVEPLLKKIQEQKKKDGVKPKKKKKAPAVKTSPKLAPVTAAAGPDKTLEPTEDMIPLLPPAGTTTKKPFIPTEKPAIRRPVVVSEPSVKTEPMDIERNDSTRDSLSTTLPSAASLVKETFGDDFSTTFSTTREASDISLQLQDLQQPLARENSGSTIDRSVLMETLSTSSWLRTFRSLENSSYRTIFSGGSSLRGIVEEEEGQEECSEWDSSISALDLAFTPEKKNERAFNAEVIRLTTTQASNFSLLSDLTDTSGGRRGSSRSIRMINAAMGNSGLSVLTDFSGMSDTIKGMDLASL